MKGFRCPSCGQAHEMELDGKTLITMNKEMNTIFVNGEELTDGQTLQVGGCETIKCHECHESDHTPEEWATAFTDPLKYFDMEALCHCGGELWMDQIPGTSSYGFVCEDCNWVKPKAKVSGA